MLLEHLITTGAGKGVNRAMLGGQNPAFRCPKALKKTGIPRRRTPATTLPPPRLSFARGHPGFSDEKARGELALDAGTNLPTFGFQRSAGAKSQ